MPQEGARKLALSRRQDRARLALPVGHGTTRSGASESLVPHYLGECPTLFGHLAGYGGAKRPDLLPVLWSQNSVWQEFQHHFAALPARSDHFAGTSIRWGSPLDS